MSSYSVFHLGLSSLEMPLPWFMIPQRCVPRNHERGVAVDVLIFRLPSGAVLAGNAAAVVIVAASDHEAGLLSSRSAPHLFGNSHLGCAAFATPVADHKEVEAAGVLRLRDALGNEVKR